MRDLLLVMVTATTAAATTIILVPRTAQACSPVDPYFSHRTDPTHATDTVPPGAVTASADVYYDRGTAGGCGPGPACTGSYGTRIVIAPSATDDATPADRIGYRFEVVGGQPPADLKLPVLDVEPAYGDIGLTFHDPQPFAFALEVRAVDLNGNVGPPTVVTVASDGAPDDGGCSVGSSSAPLGTALVMLTLWGLNGGRRRASSQRTARSPIMRA